VIVDDLNNHDHVIRDSSGKTPGPLSRTGSAEKKVRKIQVARADS